MGICLEPVSERIALNQFVGGHPVYIYIYVY